MADDGRSAPPPSVRLCNCRARRCRHRRRRRRRRRPRIRAGLRRAERLRRRLGGRNRDRCLRPGAGARRAVGGHRGRVVLDRRWRLASGCGRQLRPVLRGRRRRRRPDRVHLPLSSAERRTSPGHARRRIDPLERWDLNHADDRELRDRCWGPHDAGGAEDHFPLRRRGRKTGGGRSKSRRSRQAPPAYEYAPRRPPSTRKDPRPPRAPRRPDGESPGASSP